MSANLVKYLHLHKNFNWHHLLNSKENSFSCLSRAIAASSRTSSFPKHRLMRKNRQHTHEAFPKHRLVRKNRQHTHEAFPKPRLVRKNRQHTLEAFPKHRLVRKNRQHTHEADLLISQRPIC